MMINVTKKVVAASITRIETKPELVAKFEELMRQSSVYLAKLDKEDDNDKKARSICHALLTMAIGQEEEGEGSRRSWRTLGEVKPERCGSTAHPQECREDG